MRKDLTFGRLRITITSGKSNTVRVRALLGEIKLLNPEYSRECAREAFLSQLRYKYQVCETGSEARDRFTKPRIRLCVFASWVTRWGIGNIQFKVSRVTQEDEAQTLCYRRKLRIHNLSERFYLYRSWY